MKYAFKVTTSGRALLAELMAEEKPLELTRAVVGSGTIGEDAELADQHVLLAPVADAEITERRHEEERLYLTVQYDNSVKENRGNEMFYLAEFIVYARGTDGAEVALLYATLGDYKQPVPGYSQTEPPSVFKFPLVLIVSDRLSVTYSGAAGLVTYDDLHASVTDACEKLVKKIAAGGIQKTIDCTIPKEGWGTLEIAEHGFAYFYDLVDPDITENMIPDVVIAEESLACAGAAGICQTVTSFDGYIRLKAVSAPEKDIDVSVHLLVRGSGGSVMLPAASETTRGGVIVESGSGLKIDEEGRISLDVATDDDFKDIIDGALGEGASDESGSGTGESIPGDAEVAADNEVSDMITDIFGEQP